MRKRITLLAITALFIASTFTSHALAISGFEQDAIRHVYEPWDPRKAITCSTGSGSGVLDGFALPATHGFTARESAIEPDGTATELGSKVTFAKHASNNKHNDGGQSLRDYAINMRWTYTKWFWNGTSTETTDQKQRAWMEAEPRLVTVTNPRTKKSVVTAILESGPAPWTGVDTANNNDAKFGWQQPQLGTPPDGEGYKGRVSGLTPKAFEAIGAIMGERNGQVGDDLQYTWTPDQNAKPGPAEASINPPANSPSGATCNNAGFVNPDGYAFPVGLAKNVADNGWNRENLGWPCASICHHDGTGAFDISHTDTVKKGNDNAAIGTPVYAIISGKIESLNNNYGEEPGCNAFQVVGSDGWWYWYGHLSGAATHQLQDGKTVTAGQQLAVIGPRKCTGNGSYPHLHIDRGSPKGHYGGDSCCRESSDFVKLMNALYNGLK